VEIIDGTGEGRDFAKLVGQVCSVLVAGPHVYMVVRCDTHTCAILFEIELLSGRIVSETPLSSCDIDLAASPSGNRIAISDRRNNTVSTRGTSGHQPCPAAPPVTTSTGSQQPPAPDSCSCPAGGGQTPVSTQGPYGSTASPGDGSPCVPGSAGVPDDHGSTMVGGNGGVSKRPQVESGGNPYGGRGPSGNHQVGGGVTQGPMDCYGHLAWQVDRLRWAGSFVLATQGNYMRRMAVLQSSDMRVVQQRDFGNQGALVFANPTTEAALLYHPKRGVWEWIDLVDDRYISALDRKPHLIDPFSDQKTFTGQQTYSLIKDHVPTMGEVRVIVLPVVEPGQAYNDPDLGKLGAFLQKSLFSACDAFYHEASYNQTWTTFRTLGLDVGPAGKPLVLPKGIGSYFYPPFFPGGGDISIQTKAPGPHVSFEGSETMVLHAQPREEGRQADDFTVRFSAASLLSNQGAFPVKLMFNGVETAHIIFTDRNAASHTLNLTFPAGTVQIDSGAVPAGLQSVADFLDSRIQAAEQSAGFAARVFAKPVVKRVQSNNLDFGELHIQLAFAPTLAAGPQPAAVTTVTSFGSGAADLGFTNAIPGMFTFGPDAVRFGTYLSRLLRLAEEEKDYTFVSRMFSDTVTVSSMATMVTMSFRLSDDDGGPGAFILLNSSSFLAGSVTVGGSESTKDNANAPKDMGTFINDTFTAALARIGGSDPVSFFNGYHVVIVGMVGAPTGIAPAEAWSAAAPSIPADLREAQMMWTAVDNTDKARQFKSRWILQFLNGGASAATLSHEMGHAYGFRDLYEESAHRKDLRYLDEWALMGHESNFPHHAAYHKWQAGWIPESRILDVPKPDPIGPINREALLVPNEFWDDGMEAAVKAAYGGSDLPVVQLIRMDLGGDGGMFNLVEARQKGSKFSQFLPAQPALLVTNAIEPWDDTRYALNDRYRRELQLLNTGLDLTAVGTTFNLGAAPVLPARGITVKIQEIRDVPRPSGVVKVFHVMASREKADYVDLGFTSADPYYKNPDVWLDWPGDNPGGSGPEAHRSYPEGMPIDQGETIQVPKEGVEPHWMVARVRNYGTVRAEQVKLEYFICQPPGAGDRGNFQLMRSPVVPVIQPGIPLEVPANWDVYPTDGGHSCLLVQIADYTIPRDTNGIALGSDDVFKANNHAQKNFDQFVAAKHSPYEPVEFDYSVNNDGVFDEVAYLDPLYLPYGMKLTVSPVRRRIKPKETAIFHLKLELDDQVIDAGCRNDHEFTLVTWRETGESVERWGAVHYKIRPRLATKTTISGGWYNNNASVSGAVSPDPGAGTVLRVRINFNNQKAYWTTVTLTAGGTYKMNLAVPAEAASLQAEAMFEGNTLLAPSRSDPVTVSPYVIK
jgi:hypothetical protein